MRVALFFKDLIHLICRLILFILSPLTRFVMWIKPIFEGGDGQASGKRFTTYLFVFLAFYMLWQDKLSTMIHFYGFLAVLCAIPFMWGMITFSNINDTIRTIRGTEETSEQEQVKQEDPKDDK